jgi:ABC-type phosphate/phosphonate transport system substrate-binding protein
MKRCHLPGLGLLAAIWAIALPLPARAGDDTTTPAVRISLVSSLFRDTSNSLIDLLARPMMALMETQTGLTPDLQPSIDAQTLAKQLQDGRTDLGVFHGFEYAWVRQAYPDLKPLVVIQGSLPTLHAYLVVRHDCKAITDADLKGKILSLPRRSREHCHLFLERCCCGGAKQAKDFYSRICTPSDPDDALRDVVDGRVQAAIVDQANLEEYRKNKPERAKLLRVLIRSEPFPSGVIVYHSGSVPEKTLQRFRDGMITAHHTDRGKQLLKLCHINCFALVPESYEDQLQAISKAYPSPK